MQEGDSHGPHACWDGTWTRHPRLTTSSACGWHFCVHTKVNTQAPWRKVHSHFTDGKLRLGRAGAWLEPANEQQACFPESRGSVPTLPPAPQKGKLPHRELESRRLDSLHERCQEPGG